MKDIMKFAQKIEDAGGKAFVVGGWIRDIFTVRKSVDMDFVVTGLSEQQFVELFPNAPKLFTDAPIWMVDGDEVALARKEVSTGDGKQDFVFVAEPSFTIEDDLFRRDFTMNAVAIEILSGKIVDPFDGIQDIFDGIIRPVSEHFVESPERVLRGCALKARFPEMKFHRDFIIFAQEMKPSMKTISPEQVSRQGLSKALLKGEKPSEFFFGLMVVGWLEELFPEVFDLIGCVQDSEWHPEGDTFMHTMHVIDHMSTIEDKSFITMVAGICHDLGKPETTTFDDDGRIRSKGHASVIEPTESFMDRIGMFETDSRKKVIALVKNHMAHLDEPSKRAVRRLSKRLHPATIDELAIVVESDFSGRPPIKKGMPESFKAIVDMAKEMKLEKEPFKPILMGRHLIELGLKPSKEFGILLQMAEEAEICEVFNDLDGAIEFVKKFI